MVQQPENEILQNLNNAQREAVLWRDGPLLVIAGPGTGKTRVLTRRIVNLLQETPDKNFRILGLTFTNKAADEMRDRVEKHLPSQKHRLFLGTFHSFCADILRQHGSHIGINPDFRIYSQKKDRQTLLDDAVKAAKQQSPLVTDNDRNMLPVIQRLKSSLVLPEDTHQTDVIPEYIRDRVVIVYEQYEAHLSSVNALDFESLILRAYQLFVKYPAIAKRYRTVYPYICIDEFQDTNAAQYGLITALASNQHRNLFVVADDDQIIYQWNGASYKRLDEFRAEFQPHVIQLPENYRCPSRVIELANNLIRYNFLRDGNKESLISHKQSDDDDVVRLKPFSDFDEEVQAIAADIQQRHNEHLGKVTVLARNRKLLSRMEQALQDIDMKCLIVQRQEDFESTPFIWLHSILCLANSHRSQSDLEAVCGSFAQLTHIEIKPEDVSIAANIGNKNYFQHWITITREVVDSRETTDSSGLASKLLDNVEKNLVEARNWKTFSKDALELFKQLTTANKSNDENIEEPFANYDGERRVWLQVVSNINSSASLETLLQELEMRSKAAEPDQDTVRLMTIHAAKGQEFSYVYLIGMVEGELPSFQSVKQGDDSPEMEEERRNCFVAITRVRETLTMSYSKRIDRWNKSPSRFLREMRLLDFSF